MEQGKRAGLAHARLALEDARHVVQEVRDLPQDTPGWLLRSRWVSALTLLRLVGHVIDTTEAQSGTRKSVIDQWWSGIRATKPQPSIFWSFIYEDRNLLLKNYEFRLKHVGPLVLAAAPGVVLSIGPGMGGLLVNKPGLTISEGMFKDRFAPDLCDEAIAWWGEQITLLESKIGQAGG